MTNKITASQFCKEMLLAIEKHLEKDNKTKIISDSSNFLYYAPSIFSFEAITQNTDDSFLQGFLNIWNYINSHPNNKVSTKLADQIKFRTQNIMNVPKAWSLNIDVRLFDDKVNIVADYSIKDIRFGSPVPNKAYVYPYISNGHKRYYGIMIPYPKLRIQNSYRLEIIEHYTLNANHKKGNFTRKLIIPINVGKVDNKHLAKFSAGMDTYELPRCNLFEFYNRKANDWKLSFSELNNKVDWRKNYGCKHEQKYVEEKQLILFGDSVVPRLLMEMGNISQPMILNTFNGSNKDLYNSILNYINQFRAVSDLPLTQLSNKALAKSLILATDDSLSKSLIASTVNARVGNSFCNKELNHNGLGCTNVNIYNMLFNKESRRIPLHDKYPYQVRSQYDFEELLPAITVNAVD